MRLSLYNAVSVFLAIIMISGVTFSMENEKINIKQTKNATLNPESEQAIKDAISMNEVSKKVSEIKSQHTDLNSSPSINISEEIFSTYVKDLIKLAESIKNEPITLKRKELVNQVHEKNNPFSTFYY